MESAAPQNQPILDNFIISYQGLLTRSLCKTLISLFKDSDKKTKGKVFDANGQHVEALEKVSLELVLDTEGKWAEPHRELHEKVSQAVMSYVNSVPALQVAPLCWSAYKMKCYKKNKGQFKWHFDAASKSSFQRQLAIILYLNDVTQGGGTHFYHQQVGTSPRQGDAILFPPFWTHMHCGDIPVSEDKYIITSFAEFQEPSTAKE